MMNIGFLIYDSRSGSTFLSKKLHEYDDLIVSPESAFISRILDSHLDFNKISNSDIVNFLFKEPHFQELNIDKLSLELEIENLRSQQVLTYQSIINGIIGMLSAEFPAKWIIIKHPLFDHMDKMVEYFPNCKFIHIVRDPRGVHNSKSKSINLQGKVFSDNPFKTSLKYNYKISKAISFEKLHENKILHIRYEDLLQDQSKYLECCLSFLECSNSKTLNKSYSKEIGVLQKHLHKNVNSSAINDRGFVWKNELSKNEINIISYFSKAHIEFFKYEYIEVKFSQIAFPIVVLGFKYMYTSITNFIINSVKNPELINSKVVYFKSFFKN